MKTLPRITLLVCLSFTWTCFRAQNFEYNWKNERARYVLDSSDNKLPLVFLMNKIILQYQKENSYWVQYTAHHKIIRVNTDEAIQMSNKIIVPLQNVMQIVDIKARSINPDGKAIVLDKSNIKEISGGQGNDARSYKIFAIEGVEKGSEIEYFYVLRMLPAFYSGDFLQYDIPVKHTSFKLVAPLNLVFMFKGYNGFPGVHDTIVDGNNQYTSEIFDIPGLRQEEFSNYQKNRMRFEFKLAYNTTQSNKELFTWADVAQNLYNDLYPLNKKEKKAARKLYKQLGIDSIVDPEQRIKNIEIFLKTNFSVQESGSPGNSLLDEIIKNRYGSKVGIIKLYATLFQMAGIDHQVVLGSPRDLITFDGSFQSWRFLNNYLFYFDAFKTYLTPEDPAYRYGMVPAQLTATDALFVKPETKGQYTKALFSIGFIPPLDYQLSQNNHDITVTFNEQLDRCKVHIDHLMSGYNSVYVQPFYEYLPALNKRNLLETLMRANVPDGKFINLEAFNTDPNQSPLKKPFRVIADVESYSALENAGNKLLFKVGELIGPQVQMYQDNKRQMPVENDYNRMYKRVIRFEVPYGYTVKNLDNAVMDFAYARDSNEVYAFHSRYTLDGQLVTIDVDEFYKEIYCPVANYEEFRKVINAAADFNKLTLIFEPKEP